MKIFISYGHDANTPLVLRIRRDLEAAGHAVWIDTSEIKTGDDWRRRIVDGLSDTNWTLGFLSRHSTRSPGVCLDELAIALHVKSGMIATVLVEAEAVANPPVSVSHIQWLDMHDWAARSAAGAEEFEVWYRPKLGEILSLVGSPYSLKFRGEIAQLEERLRPISQDAEIGALIDGFFGRDWLKSKLDEWRRCVPDSRLFWISGAPGTGKSAFAAWLAHYAQANVIGVNFCRYNVDERRDPSRVLCTLAFQIATRLPDYRRLLLDRLTVQDPEKKAIGTKTPAALFDWLLAEPLRFGIDGGRVQDRYLIVIDALDETIRDGRSALAEVLAESSHKLPQWIAIIVTSRPEPSILRQFAGLKPQTLDSESTENKDDLRAYTRRWLTIESLGGGELDARVERIVAASGGNFLYLRKLQEAAMLGHLDLEHPDDFPQGLVGLYERWFRRQFPDLVAYEGYLPLLAVLAAAEHPVPEPWLARIFGWSEREKTNMLEGLGSLFQRRKDGIAPFHKSLRDWLVDGRTSGADFVVDVADGRRRLVDALWAAFLNWAAAPDASELDAFCQIELVPQLASENSAPRRLLEFAQIVADPTTIGRKLMIGSGADEDTRRTSRHNFRELIDAAARAWPLASDASSLWAIVETLNRLAWATVGRLPDLRMLQIWDDIGMPASQRSTFDPALKYYAEWNENVLLLVTAMDSAFYVARSRPELASKLPTVMDRRLREFLDTDANGFVDGILRGTAGREYVPERNMSFLRYPIQQAYDSYKADPRLVDWIRKWSSILQS
jgi:hypothetical protein